MLLLRIGFDVDFIGGTCNQISFVTWATGIEFPVFIIAAFKVARNTHCLVVRMASRRCEISLFIPMLRERHLSLSSDPDAFL